MSELTDMTNEVLTSSLNERVNEIEQLVLELEERYDLLWKSYEELDEDHNRLGYKNLELKEENDVLKQEESKNQEAYDLGFKDGEYSMQKKAYKICEYWNNNDTAVLSKLFDGWTWTQIFEDIETAYNKIAEYEKKEKEIKVGDEVVDCDGTKYVVRFLNDCSVDALAYNGVSVECDYADISKTGKHYPLEEMLKELGQ